MGNYRIKENYRKTRNNNNPNPNPYPNPNPNPKPIFFFARIFSKSTVGGAL